MRNFKNFVKAIFNRYGLDVSRYQPGRLGISPYADMKHFLHVDAPIVIDAGANQGQMALRLKQEFPKCMIHSFEPSPTTFEMLKQNVSCHPSIYVWNAGLGASSGKQMFLENTHSDMSSFLTPSASTWGKVHKHTEVDVRTLDEFCAEQGIDRIDILKSDTQGYDLEVLKGANKMMYEGRVNLVYVEVTFYEMYKGAPTFGDLCRYLDPLSFRLVALYPIIYKDKMAGWTDALFAYIPKS